MSNKEEPQRPQRPQRPAHRWSGWPGAYCLDCSCEHALENAIGLSWLNPFTDEWISPLHKELITLCDGYCPTHTPSEEYLEVHERCTELEVLIKEWDILNGRETGRETGRTDA